MKTFTKHAIALAAAAFATQAAAQVTVYDREQFDGRSFTSSTRIDSTSAASVAILDNNMWEACDRPGFGGFCIRLLPGCYPTIQSMGHRNPVASLRVVDERADNRPIPLTDRRPDPRVSADLRADGRDYRRRRDERVYEVPVANVRAIVGAAEQRCWVEREQVSSGPNVGGAVAGAVIGGILGHQIGHGGGRDAATVGGAVVGGAIGANAGRERGYQDVQRCATVSGQAPEYWEVTYYFRGYEHRIQMSAPPGPTITVNESGEPR